MSGEYYDNFFSSCVYYTSVSESFSSAYDRKLRFTKSSGPLEDALQAVKRLEMNLHEESERK